jgi:hypothetical protein
VLRGGALALCCVLLALAGHVLGGGSGSSVLPLLVVGAPLAAAFAVWADRQRGLRELTVAALCSQPAFHVVFLLCGANGVLPHSRRWNGAMVLGHGLAALAIAWVLSRGEAALWSLYRVLHRVVRVVLLRARDLDLGPVRVAAVAVVPARCGVGLLLASALGRRGPPRPLAA